MCRGAGFTITGRDVAVILGIGVVLSPLLIPVGIVYAVGSGTAAVVNKAARTVEEHRDAKKREETFAERLAAAAASTEFQAVLQAAYDKTLAAPSFASFAELAVCLFTKRDYYGAHAFFLKAEEQAAAKGEKPTPEQANALYLHGLALQMMARFATSVEYFDKAAALLPAAPSAASPIARSDALVHAGYSAYLNFMFPKFDPSYDMFIESTDARREKLRPALVKLNEAVTAAPDNRLAKLVRAWIEYQLTLTTLAYDEASGTSHVALQTPHLQAAHSDCKEVFDWAHKVTADELRAEGIATADVRALLAHILLVMGQRAEASALIAEPDPYGGKVFGTEYPQSHVFGPDAPEDPIPYLFSPWPLPEGLVVDTAVEKHTFERHFFKTPTYCDLCAKFISLKQNVSGAFRCKTCGFDVHGDCLAAAQEQFCLITRDTSDKSPAATHTHVFLEHRLHRVRRCCVCSDAIMVGTTGGQCTACNQFAHKRCLQKADAVSSPK